MGDFYNEERNLLYLITQRTEIEREIAYLKFVTEAKRNNLNSRDESLSRYREEYKRTGRLLAVFKPWCYGRND